MAGQITGGYDPGTIAHFKGILLAQKVRLMARLQRNGDPVFVEELNGAERQDKPRIIERHSIEVVGDQEQLRDVERSLQKCEDGTYGICECGVVILLARLEAISTASRCVPCQAKHKSHNPRETKPLRAFGNNPLGIFSAKKVRVGQRLVT